MTLTNNYGTWIDSEIVTVGAVSIHNVEFLNEEVDSSDSINLSYIAARAEFMRDQMAQWQSAQDDQNAAPPPETIEEWEWEFDDGGYIGDEEEYLIGKWELGADGKYSPDHTGEYSASVSYDGMMVCIVHWSRYATRGALCSPCISGAVDLDNEGEYLGYDLPLDLYGGSRENSNPQIELEPSPSAPDGSPDGSPAQDGTAPDGEPSQ